MGSDKLSLWGDRRRRPAKIGVRFLLHKESEHSFRFVHTFVDGTRHPISRGCALIATGTLTGESAAGFGESGLPQSPDLILTAIFASLVSSAIFEA